jgi:ribosomal protein S3
MLLEDIKVREFLKQEARACGGRRVVIERPAKNAASPSTARVRVW